VAHEKVNIKFYRCLILPIVKETHVSNTYP